MSFTELTLALEGKEESEEETCAMCQSNKAAGGTGTSIHACMHLLKIYIRKVL
jgi:hypothetical protein